ncbi:hypothetical protein AALP_AAs51945U000100, partial [Arabis alpina]
NIVKSAKATIKQHCCETDNKGNMFGLEKLQEIVNKRKRKESYASS